MHKVLVRKEDKHILENLRNKTNVEGTRLFSLPPFSRLIGSMRSSTEKSPRPIYISSATGTNYRHLYRLYESEEKAFDSHRKAQHMPRKVLFLVASPT